MNINENSQQIGGITGQNGNDCNIINCYNSGEIQINNKGYMIGGIVAYGGKIFNCYNLGSITSLNKIYFGAGISANNRYGDTIENCYNISVIDSDKFTCSGRNLWTKR